MLVDWKCLLVCFCKRLDSIALGWLWDGRSLSLDPVSIGKFCEVLEISLTAFVINFSGEDIYIFLWDAISCIPNMQA